MCSSFPPVAHSIGSSLKLTSHHGVQVPFHETFLHDGPGTPGSRCVIAAGTVGGWNNRKTPIKQSSYSIPINDFIDNLVLGSSAHWKYRHAAAFADCLTIRRGDVLIQLDDALLLKTGCGCMYSMLQSLQCVQGCHITHNTQRNSPK